MNEPLELFARAAVIGAAGSALIDIWSLALRHWFHVRTLDYAMVGRWLGHMPKGRIAHERIGASPAVRGERPLGWIAHYAIGISFALVLLLIEGHDWAHSPTLAPALIVGLATIAAPWFVMQPAFGMGIAGSRTPNPWPGRLRNLGTHAVYGVGLYLTAVAISGV
ncbi:MAG: DUF2938 domain-containing protein [Dehalococcoidia bacterium]